MKFGKEFTSQMVPEWRDAYMDYNCLKALLKDILRSKQKSKQQEPPPSSSSSNGPPAALKRRLTLYRAFSGLTHRISSPRHQSPAAADMESQVILVNSVSRDGSDEACYETTFLMSAEEGAEQEAVYFRRADDELNKVVKFCTSKMEEVVKEADMLNKQMNALIAFRIKVEKPHIWFDGAAEITRLASDVAASAAALSASTPSGARATKHTGRVVMEVIEEDKSSSHGQSDESADDKEVKEEKKRNGIRGNRPAPMEILNRVKMNNTRETPRSTIKGILRVPNQAELKFSKENLKKVEEQLKRAFVEFHHKLRLLKSYSFLNILAFSKIMKKYDKITSRKASASYMKMVDESYLGSSDEVTKLMERVEVAFIKHFCNSNRKKGMNILRPKAKRERHRTTFSLGFFAGCTAALILALILVIRAQNILNHAGREKYMQTLFPLYMMFGFIFLHMVMYAANIFFWRRYKINYSFIFGFKEGTELGYREVLLLGFGLSMLALTSVLANLDMEMEPKTKEFKAVTELLPLGLLVLVLVILLCPFNIIYRSNRLFFLTCILHCICAPLYKVTLPDFFLADQLTSQVQAIRSLEFYICYYFGGDFKVRETSCGSNGVYNTFYFIIAVIPYWSRLVQCIRRLYEERDFMHGLNGLKYFSTIAAVCARTAYSLNKGIAWRVTAGVTSGIAAISSTYWDLVLDWGLLQKNSKNRWLRDKLLVPHRSVYFIAMVLNVLLRFAWLQSVLNFEVSFLHRQATIAIISMLEITRRGIWNFFRLENEHLNNVGKFRAFKSVPLPFNYDEDDENKDA